MNLRQLLDVLVGLDTERELDLKVGETSIKHINFECEQVLLASILGDGHLGIHKERGRNYYFKEEHSISQEEYVRWKASYLRVFNAQVRIYDRYDKRFKEPHYKSVVLYTNCSPQLNPYTSLTVSEILCKLEEFGLAVWYCDDGSKRKRSDYAYLCINSFTERQHEIVIDWFQKEHSITATTDPQKTLCFQADEARKLFRIIRPYVPTCMKYKLSRFC